MLKRIRLLLKETVTYTVCASLVSLPYYGTASAQTSSTNANMQSAAMAGREMQNSAISDLKGYVNKLGYGAKDLVPQSVDGVNNGKGMTVEDIQKLMGIYKDNDEYRKQGNAYIVDLEKRSINADSSDPEAVAYSVLKTVSAFPKNQIADSDPIVQKTKETLEGLEDFSKTLADCTPMEEYLLQERVVHEPIYEQCTKVIDKTGSCQIQHLYDLTEPVVHQDGPYNISSCGEGCISIWLGKVGDNYIPGGSFSYYEEEMSFRVVKPKALKSVKLDYAAYDDLMRVYVGPKGKERMIYETHSPFPYDDNNQRIDGVRCEYSTHWIWDPTESGPGCTERSCRKIQSDMPPVDITIDFLPSINEEDSYRFSDSRSLMSKLPRRVSASAGLPKGVQLGFCTFSKRSFTCSDTTVYSFRSHISPQTSLRDSPPLDLKR